MSGIEELNKDIEEMFKYAPPPAPEPEPEDDDDDLDASEGKEPADPPAPPTPPAEPTELEQLKAQIATLKAQIETSAANKGQDPPAAPPAPVERPKLTEMVSEEEFASALTDRTKFNEILLRVYNAAREDTLVELPSVVEVTAQRQKALQASVTKFYTDNEDLKDYSGIVGLVANTVASEYPNKDLDFIFAETAKRSREMLKIQEGAQKKEEERGSPAFPRRPGASPRGGAQDTRTEQQKQIADIMGMKQ